MSDNNTNTDTPQGQNQYQSLEEAVFDSGSEIKNDAFTSSDTQEQSVNPAPEQGQPELSNQGSEPAPANNDETIYQYWQSKADKYKNELQAIQQQQSQAFAQQQSQVPNQPQAQQAMQPQEESFPEPPERPMQPRSFNREEAYSDPSSDSARYMNELEDWRDDMNEYNSIKSQYQTALVEEKLNNMKDKMILRGSKLLHKCNNSKWKWRTMLWDTMV